MEKKTPIRFTQICRWVFLSALAGFFAGCSSALFLYLLDWATKTRLAHVQIIWLLPLAGLVIGLVYHHLGQDVTEGNNLILDEIHDPKKKVPLKMTPFILGGTVITHLFGGSAGREGTAVQMGASLADQVAHFFKVSRQERTALLCAGAGAGFGAAIGTPFAGFVFGMEVIRAGKLKLSVWLECAVASAVAYATALILRAPHSLYPEVKFSAFNLQEFACVLAAGVAFGAAAFLFIRFTHLIEKCHTRFIKYPPFKPLVGGVILVLLFAWEGTYRFAGLGISIIQDALQIPFTFDVPFLKGIFTAITIGSGFKGGEFIPLVFIGTTLGSALSQILPASHELLAVVGFAAVFGGAANTPLACTLMVVELFGLPVAPYALAGCYVSYLCSGKKSIYRSQLK